MSSSVFLSYSRREAPFVDSLADQLEDNGFKVWLDYKSLVPAKPWEEQIYQGIAAADTFVFVVSKESLASPYVEDEWKHAVELNKRIVLVLFESTALPSELAHREWVEFRSNFNTGVQNLLDLLKTPRKPEQPAPQKGFKAPKIVWASFVSSLIVAIISLPLLWTLYIPYHLMRLPYRIFKRDFNFFHVQSALIMVPLAYIFNVAIFSGEEDVSDLFMCGFVLSLLVPFILIFLLRSSGMQRWGKPKATLPKFSNLHIPEVKNPQPVRFTIDVAPEDKKYADGMTRVLEKYGHTYVPEGDNAEAAFVFISAFKRDTHLNPEEQSVFPIILQATEDIDQKLQMIQWIDFRQGLRNLDALAQLLPEPARLLKALGIAPTGNQTVLPRIVRVLDNFIILLAIFSISSWAVYLFQFSTEILEAAPIGSLACLIMILISFFALIFFTNRSLTSRKGKLSSPYVLGFVILLIAIIFFAQFMASIILEEAIGIVYDETENRGLSFIIAPVIYLVGLIIIIPMAFWYRHDFLRWFPAKNKNEKPSVQQA